MIAVFTSVYIGRLIGKVYSLIMNNDTHTD